MAPSVPITPTLPVRVARVAASTPASITPQTGTAQRPASLGSATADAVLHATTTPSTPSPHR